MTTVACDPTTSVTRSLLGYGVLAGPFYVAVSLLQAFTRDGFDLARHPWSVLANGGPGWIQMANLVLSGLMVIAATAGMRRMGLKWGPRLLTGYGAGLIAAGIFTADPVPGFPVGTTTAAVSWHGLLHFVTGGIGFLCLIAACFVLAKRVVPVFSRITGVVFFAGFAGIASGGGSAAMNLAFTAAVIVAWAWLSVVSLRLYKEA